MAGEEVEEVSLHKNRKEQLDFERVQLELELDYEKKDLRSKRPRKCR